jgi:hypothetical protein
MYIGGSIKMAHGVFDTRGCIQKFPDWPPGELELRMVQLLTTRCAVASLFYESV